MSRHKINQEFTDIIEVYGDSILPDPVTPTDGWDTTEKPSKLEQREGNDPLPLGHIALQGDFDTPPHPEL